MENMPIADESVDWIISNCVINLSPDKQRVFQEAFRVLRTGGKIMVSDIVAERIPEKLKGYLWSSCVGGALDESNYLRVIREAGFEEVKVVDRLDYDRETIQGLLDSGCLDLPTEVRGSIDQHDGEWRAKIASIKVSARKRLEPKP
jgi:SAM-dependent methyltransferase